MSLGNRAIPEQMLTSRPGGRRSVGRPVSRWQDRYTRFQEDGPAHTNRPILRSEISLDTTDVVRRLMFWKPEAGCASILRGWKFTPLGPIRCIYCTCAYLLPAEITGRKVSSTTDQILVKDSPKIKKRRSAPNIVLVLRISGDVYSPGKRAPLIPKSHESLMHQDDNYDF
jgi:hypothetical protein